MRLQHSTGELLAATPFANLLDLSEAVAVADANAFTSLRWGIEVILPMNDSGVWADLLDEILGGFSEDGSAIDATIGERLFDPCVRTKLVQSNADLLGKFSAAQQLAHVRSCYFVMNLDDAAGRLVLDDEGGGLAPFELNLSPLGQWVNSRQ
jgi:hypothetical protein